MKKNASRVGITVFFAAVLVVSAVVIARKDGSDSVQTVNNLPEDEKVTDMIAEETTGGGYRRDIDFDASVPSSFDVMQTSTQAETSGEEYEEDENGDIPAETAPPSSAEQTVSRETTSRTVITSRQRKEYDSNSVYIDMANILQNPELPVGCEITALTILLRYYGFDAEKTDMARNYLPTSWGNTRSENGRTYKDSFFDYFIGDPFSKGYGCFSPAIERAANSYISSHGGGYTVKNISGCHPDTLYEYLIAGTPVLCWATDGMIEPEFYETWYDNDTGEQLDWYLNEHCFVLAGFNISGSTVTLNDPMKGIIDYNIDKFEVRFKQMYSQAIVLIPEGGQVITPAESAVPETEITQAYENTETAAQLITESLWENETEPETEQQTETESVNAAQSSDENNDEENVFTGF